MVQHPLGPQSVLIHDQIAREFYVRRFAAVERIATRGRLMHKSQRIVGHGFQLGLKRRKQPVGIKRTHKRDVALAQAVVVDGRDLEIHLLVVDQVAPYRLVEINGHTLGHHQPLGGFLTFHQPRLVIGTGQVHGTGLVVLDIAPYFARLALSRQFLRREGDGVDLVEVDGKLVVVELQVAAGVAQRTGFYLSVEHERPAFAHAQGLVGRKAEYFQ